MLTSGLSFSLDEHINACITNMTNSADHLAPLNRSSGSPDSFRSESSSEKSDSVSDTIRTLEEKAATVGDKPSHSYVALISMAILSSENNRILLGDIYQFIMNRFPYYNNQEKAWRNSIRHNLSINECFIKNGRADNGKGHYWSIHPACVEDFSQGDFRRRQARRRARKGVKDVKRSYWPIPEYTRSTGYVPMTSSPVGSQSMTSPVYGYQSITSSHGYVPYQRVTGYDVYHNHCPIPSVSPFYVGNTTPGSSILNSKMIPQYPATAIPSLCNNTVTNSFLFM